MARRKSRGRPRKKSSRGGERARSPQFLKKLVRWSRSGKRSWGEEHVDSHGTIFVATGYSLDGKQRGKVNQKSVERCEHVVAHQPP